MSTTRWGRVNYTAAGINNSQNKSTTCFLVGDVMLSEQNNGGSSCLEGRLHTTAY